MQVKRFVAANMRQALNLVREELGDEAVILSNKRVAEGVELLISVDEPVLGEVSTEGSGIDILRDAITEPEQERTVEAQPGKLQVEAERIQREARQRADTLAASMSQQAGRSSSFATELYQQQRIEKTAAEQVQPEPLSEIQPVVTAAAKAAAGQEVARNKELDHLRAELQSMRDIMEQQFSNIAWGQFSQRSPEQASIWRRMKRLGASSEVINHVLQALPMSHSAAANWQQAMKLFSEALPVEGADTIGQGGIFALVGPTGVGKTTTIAKLAARYVMEHGADDVALVTMDTHRIAGYEQLRTVGRILNVPVKLVDKNNNLDEVLHNLRHKSLVLIDTAGFRRGDERLQAQLRAVNELGGRAKTLLVLAATAQAQVMHAAFDNYLTDNLVGSIITKLDETLSLGEVLSLMVERQLPIAYSTHGQSVPEDIERASRAGLVKQAITLAQGVDIDEQDMAEALAYRAKTTENSDFKSRLAG